MGDCAKRMAQTGEPYSAARRGRQRAPGHRCRQSAAKGGLRAADAGRDSRLADRPSQQRPDGGPQSFVEEFYPGTVGDLCADSPWPPLTATTAGKPGQRRHRDDQRDEFLAPQDRGERGGQRRVAGTSRRNAFLTFRYPPRCRRAVGGAATLLRSRPLVQPPLNGDTSGLVLEYRPAGLGYQIHTCIVVRSGCQKVNGDPVFGFVLAQVFWFSSGMNVPSL